MGGRGLILAIVTVVAALAVACGASSQDADEPATAGDASSQSVAQAAPTAVPDTPSGTGETAAPAPSLPAPEPTQPANTPTPSATDAAEEQVGLDSDINPPDPLNRDTGRRIIRFSQPDGTKERTLEIHSILPRDAIPAIDNPVFITAEEASQNLVDRDLVIGVSINGEHKAYSTAFLSSHEVVNDVIGGEPVAVTW
jgi:hypothetical protein